MKRIFMLVALLMLAQGALGEQPRVIKKIGEGIEKGEAATGRGIKKVAKYPAKGLNKTGQWLNKKVGKKVGGKSGKKEGEKDGEKDEKAGD
jgi:hypothetical protein